MTLTKPLLWLAICIALLFALSALAGYIAYTPTSPAREAAVEPPSPEMQAYLAASKGFQALVSYTNTGFHPSQVTLKKGETARFTNNSTHDMWIAADGRAGHVYPGTSDCGTSPLDTCKVVHSGDFWEFTFTTTGTWGFIDNLKKDNAGVAIIVQ